MNIKIKNTPDKYKIMADEIVLPLLELLQELKSLEEEVFKRNSELNAEKINIEYSCQPKSSEMERAYGRI